MNTLQLWGKKFRELLPGQQIPSVTAPGSAMPPTHESVNEATNEQANDESEHYDEPMHHEEIQRRGDVQKCPVCGSHVDAEAYYCSACHNYFCFHCRARLLPADTHLQCVNQQCDYYGKLTCELCDPIVEKDESPSVYIEPEDGYWPVWLVIVLIGAAVTWFYTTFLTAVFTAIIAFAGGGWFLQQIGMNVFGRETRIEHRRKKQLHTCIRCHQQTKMVAEGRK